MIRCSPLALRSNSVNGLLFAIALALAVYQAFASRPDQAHNVARYVARAPYAATTPERLEDGTLVLRDFGGQPVPLRTYQRIASGSTIADEVLLEIVAPERLIAVAARSLEHPLHGHRYHGKSVITSTEDVEHILSLAPDLVVVNTLGNEARKQRLIDVGMTVFDLGAMRGLTTLLPNIQSLGLLVGEPERAKRLATALLRRMASIAADIPEPQRLAGAYVGVHGQQLYGGTRGSSYADVLAAAGVRDVAARDFDGWPAYEPEELLQLDPPLVITQLGTAELLCRHTELSRLAACSGAGRIVEIDPLVLGSPGLDMAVAAEQIRDAVYGPPRLRPEPRDDL